MKPNSYAFWLLAVIKILAFTMSVYFLVRTGQTHWNEINQLYLNRGLSWIWLTLTMCFINILMIMLLTLGWLYWLGFIKPTHVARVYFRSQVLKYLPGNVFHFAYRHQKCHSMGFSHTKLLRASIYESLSLLTIAFLISQPLLFPLIESNWLNQNITTILGSEVVICLICMKIFAHSGIWLTTLVYLGYFLGLTALTWLSTQILGLPEIGWILLPACTISWVAGYLIPGAPGGIGIRESVFVMTLAQYIDQGHALVMIVAVRLLSLIVEVLIYFLARPLSHYYQCLSVWSDKTKS